MSFTYEDLKKEAPNLPNWARASAFYWAVWLALPTPSAAALDKLSAPQRAATRRQWAEMLRATAPPPPEKALAKCGLVIVRRGVRMLNWDNAFGGLKPLLDCMVLQDLRHPDGLGYLLDDHPESCMPHAPFLRQTLSKKDEEGTLLGLFHLE